MNPQKDISSYTTTQLPENLFLLNLHVPFQAGDPQDNWLGHQQELISHKNPINKLQGIM